MDEKKCKVCGAQAKWLRWDNEPFCECCLCRAELGLHKVVPPHRCEQCGTPIKGAYFTDGVGDAFCSRECALENWGVAKLEENDDNKD